jgi:hypothetical protein
MALTQVISTMISTALVNDLTEAFYNLDPVETPGLIRIGMLQENPVKDRIYILVHIGDPDFPEQWQDNAVIKDDEALNKRGIGGIQIPSFEVGGSVFKWRRHTIEFGFYGVKLKESRQDAQDISAAIKARIEQAVWQSKRVPGMTDDLKETTIRCFAVEAPTAEGGGKNNFIWRGKVRVQTLTNQILQFA